MRTFDLQRQSLTYYWRTNLVVVLGVATAVAVLSGALLVGDSVRASLRDLVVQRLGQTDQVITSSGFFRDQLASDIQNDPQFARTGFAAACPMIALPGTISHESSKRTASGIRVYGVDERFWKFHQLNKAPATGRDVFLSEGLARELSAGTGDSLVLRVEKPSAIPLESLHSRKEDLGSTLRLTAPEILPPEALGEFSLQPQQGVVRAAFVPLDLLQKQIDQPNKVNLILLSQATRAAFDPAMARARQAALEQILAQRTSLEDFGINLRLVGGVRSNSQRTISLEQDSKVISDSLASTVDQTAKASSLYSIPLLSYLANSINLREHAIPYSLVTGLDDTTLQALAPGKSINADSLVLNEWAARELGASAGDEVSLEYYVWHEGGQLETRTAKFTVAAVVPIAGLAADRDMVPAYPGITGTENLADWDPPFPVDLGRIRKQDEDYWDEYRTTPKAFMPLARAQELWQTRFGKLTSVRLAPREGAADETLLAEFQRRLRASLKPEAMGLAVMPVRAEGVAASKGATDFGEYFLYFSFFLVLSALMLTALFFKLGIEQRSREIGLLQAIGYSDGKIRRLFMVEGLLLAVIGSLLGLVGALAYGQFVLVGLRTWWVDAVGTTMLRLHVSPFSLLLGAVGGVLAALVCIVWTLRGLGKKTTRSLLSGVIGVGRSPTVREGHKPLIRGPSLTVGLLPAVLLGTLGLLLLVAASLHLVNQVAGFFGSGTLLLAAFLCYQSASLRRAPSKAIRDSGWWSIARLGFRNATSRPGRSVLCIALIASAAFIIVAVDSFRHRDARQTSERKSGSGGYALFAESVLPLVHDPNTKEGREALDLTTSESSLSGVTFARFRVRPGEDASCLNLYQPRNPRIIAPTGDFVNSNRFAFQSSLAATPQEKENPWLLLSREFADGPVPIIVDANSLTYVLHLKLGDDFNLDTGNGAVRLRVVASLADSVFQSELVMAETNFLRLFPDQEGYRFFLIDTPATETADAVAARLEERLSDFGFDAQPTAERLASFHRVENTYLSTFQMLGGLGLVLGTLGMAAVLLRNVLERRRELALLRAVGYDARHFTVMVLAENSLLLFSGLVTGAVCALLAIAPVLFSRHAQLPGAGLALLLLGVLLSGISASLVATWAALRSPLLDALRAE